MRPYFEVCMAAQTIASFGVLMQFANAVGKAKLSNNPEAIAKATQDLENYKTICLSADSVSLNIPNERLP